MMLNIFCVRDTKTAMYGTPMFLVSPGQALRSVSDEVNKGEATSLLFQHPEDFELFHLGSFDSSTAVFSLLPAPVSLALCSNLKLNGVSK